ncbi:uncharacterized protein [Choristoneura fumiferana]|uniref:uncharacterized protein n=1 Tax=Choristoneura fumiferana TaxID=7141 RepID=UPI003D153720
MNSSRSQNIALIIIVFFGIDVHIVTSKHLRASRVPVHLSGEFMNFLHNLGSRVFTLKAKKRFGVEHGHEDTTTASYLFSTRNVEAWKSETNFGIQKDALRDALMMKLVSYYEDKYKLSDSQTTRTTTTTSTPAHRDVRVIIDRISKIHPVSTKSHFTHTRPAHSYKMNLLPDVEVI